MSCSSIILGLLGQKLSDPCLTSNFVEPFENRAPQCCLHQMFWTSFFIFSKALLYGAKSPRKRRAWMLIALTVQHEYRKDLSGTHCPCNEVDYITIQKKFQPERERVRVRSNCFWQLIAFASHKSRNILKSVHKNVYGFTALWMWRSSDVKLN